VLNDVSAAGYCEAQTNCAFLFATGCRIFAGFANIFRGCFCRSVMPSRKRAKCAKQGGTFRERFNDVLAGRQPARFYRKLPRNRDFALVCPSPEHDTNILLIPDMAMNFNVKNISDLVKSCIQNTRYKYFTFPRNPDAKNRYKKPILPPLKPIFQFLTGNQLFSRKQSVPLWRQKEVCLCCTFSDAKKMVYARR
jgi:hypothetical protein